MNIKNNKAFSLIELSIVLIIIGLLIAGVMGGRSLMKSARIRGARVLTLGSPISQIEGLILWLEPTLESSFIDSSGNDVSYGSTVYEWRNKAGFYGYMPKAIQTSSTQRPSLIEEGINKLPTLRFDGSNNDMNITLRHSLPAGTDNFTIFIVLSANNVSSTKRIFSWATAGVSTASPSIGISSAKWYFSFWGMSVTVTSPVATVSTPTILTWKYNGTTSYAYINGIAGTPASTSATPTTPSSTSAYLGSYNEGSNYFNGDISEVIMYERALSDIEKERVEIYLKQKYKIN